MPKEHVTLHSSLVEIALQQKREGNYTGVCICEEHEFPVGALRKELHYAGESVMGVLQYQAHVLLHCDLRLAELVVGCVEDVLIG